MTFSEPLGSVRRGARRWRRLTALGGALLLLAVLGRCSSSRLAPGKACQVNSDCQAQLVCIYGKCHEACAAARDCTTGEECVKGNQGTNICLLPDEFMCAFNSQCPDGLFCSRDFKCRNQCLSSRDCATSTQICVMPDLVCAEPPDIVNGGLVAVDGGSASTDAGTGGSGAGGRGGTGGTGTAGVGGGSAGAGGFGASGGVSGMVTLDCSGPETTTNDTFGTATPYALWSQVVACLNTASDVDYYSFTIPANPAGGYIQASATMLGVGPGGGGVGADIKIYTAADQTVLAEIASQTSQQSVFVYAAVAPGASYYVAVNPTTGTATPARYTLLVTYTAIADPYEPDDTRATAATISLNQMITAYMFAGYATQTIGLFDDYYKVALQSGSVTINVPTSPMNVAPFVTFYDPQFNQITTGNATTGGGGVTIMSTAMAAGTYYVGIRPYVSNPNNQAGSGTVLPDNFITPYTLIVTQP
jgi:hypothetical protein